jgi:hypothetical protein
MSPRLRTIVLVLLASILAAVPAAAAEPLRVLVSSTDYFATDRERYAIWGDPETGALVILDTRTGQRRTVDLPAGCGVLRAYDAPEVMRHGRARLDCPTSELDLDLRTGVVAPASRRSGPRVPQAAGACRLASIAGRADPFELPSLWSAPYLLVPHYGTRSSLELRRCGHAPRAVGRGRINTPRIGGGLVSWQSGLNGWTDFDGVDNARPRAGDRLWTYAVRSGRRESWRLPHLPFDFDTPLDHVGVSWHTSDAVFWVAVLDVYCYKLCDPDRWRVYWAPTARRSANA